VIHLVNGPPPTTVRVRIAVSVDADGNWRASGESNLRDAIAARYGSLGGSARLCWVEADVPLPEAGTVVGVVVP